MSKETSVASVDTEEIATAENSCSDKDPLISIAIVLWIGVVAFVLFIYLYWTHIRLQTRHNSQAEDDLDFRRTTELAVEKELEQRSTEQYESLKRSADRKQDVYHTLDAKEEEPSTHPKVI